MISMYNNNQLRRIFFPNKMLKSLLILLLITLSTAKLYQVVSLFRHGARYHLNTLYDGNSTYNVWGELTPVGMRQHQSLGKTLNKEYIQNLKFLPQIFDKKQVEVYSTDYNRTIQSAMSQLYGLYPPGNGPKLQTVQTKYHLPPFTNQTDIDEQTFAFPQGHQHIMIKYDSTMLLENCPKYNQLIQKNLQIHQQQVQQMNLTYYPFMKKTIQVFNLSSNATFATLSSLFDTLIVDKFMGRRLPNGYTEDDLMNLQHLHNWLNNVKFSGTVSRVINSRKYTKILNEFDNRIKNLNTYPLKWTFLSAHDTDVLPAQTDLNFSSYQCIEDIYRKGNTDALNCQTDVGFASSVIFELHSDNSQDFYVMIRNQGKYMNLCEKLSTKCGYTEWRNRMKNLILSNVDEMCGLKEGKVGLRGMESVDGNVI